MQMNANIKKLMITLDIIVLVLCLFLYASNHIGRFILGADQLVQYATAKQLSCGNGLTMQSINYDDVSIPQYNVHTEFAPGVAMFASPLFMVTDNYRIVNGTIVVFLDAAFIFLTLLFFKKLLKRSLALTEITLIILLYTVSYPLLLGESISDMVCLNCVIISALCIIKYLECRKAAYLILCCFLVTFTIYFRYAYLAAVFVLPCFFLFRICALKTKEYKELLISVGFVALFSALFLGHIYSLNSTTGYVSSQSSAKGFYPENIVQSYPFPLNCFFDHNILLKILGFSSDNIDRGYEYPNWLHFIFYAISLMLLLPVLWRIREGCKQRNYSECYGIQMFMLVFSLGLLGLVFIGSIINPSQNGDYIWSWAQVGRYYMLPCYCIILCYLFCIFNIEKCLKTVRIFCLIVVGSSLLFNFLLVGRNYAINYKAFDLSHNMSVMRPNNSLNNAFNLNEYFSSIKGYKVVVVDQSLRNRLFKIEQFLNLADASVVYSDDSKLFDFKTTVPQDIYLITDNEPSQNIVTLKQEKSAVKISDLNNNIVIYKYIIEPND